MMSTQLVNKVWAKLVYWREIARQRSQLNKMDDALLKDAGISRADAEYEAKRPFWDSAPTEDRSLRSRTSPAADCALKKQKPSFTFIGADHSHSARVIS